MAELKQSIAVSGVRPTGDLHIGNYLGAIKQFAEIQKKYKTYFFIADLHAITEPQDPQKLPEQTLNIAALYLACGLDPKKTTLFVQSHIPEHLELSWILGTLTPMGELNRMTQFKEKTQDGKPANFGLFAYPVLMATDILIYGADVVPVGEDQVQHIEFTRSLARRFNEKYGVTFKEPKPLVQKEGARIMALDNPNKKMSKSASSQNNYIGMLDKPDEIERKIKIAVTDSGKEIKYDPEKKSGISNLLVIMSQFSGEPIKELEEKYKGKSYGNFKTDLGEILVQKLEPIQSKYSALVKNDKEIRAVLNMGETVARQISKNKLAEVKKKIGLI